MALAHPGGGDLHEFGSVAHVFDGFAAAIAHARPQAAGHLVDDGHQRAFVRDAAFDALGHQLVGIRIAGGRFLEVAVRAPLLHCADGAHAPVTLVAAPLEQHDLAGRLLGAGEHAAHHHSAGAGRDRLRDVTRIADAAVGDQWNAAAAQRRRDIVDGRDLGHADSGDDPGGADRTGADADLHSVRACFRQRQRGGAGGDVAADHLNLRVVFLDPTHPLDHAFAVAVRRVHDNGVDTGLHQCLHPFFRALTHAHGGTHPQPPGYIARGIRKAGLLGDVLDRDQALELERIVDHQQAFELVSVEQRLGLRRRGAVLDGDQLVARGHDLADRHVVTGFEAQVAASDDTDHLAAVDHRESGNAQLLLHVQHLPDRMGGGDDHRIPQHPGFVPFDPGHFGRLLLRREVLVDDAHAAFLGDGDRQARFRDRVHGG